MAIAETPSVSDAGAATVAGQVLDLLTYQASLFEELQALVSARRQALAAADISSLVARVAQQQTLVVRLEQAEAARLSTLRPLALALDVAPEAISLSRLCELAGPETAAALRRAQGALLEQVTRLAADGREDAGTLGACVASTTHSLQLLVRSMQASQTTPQYSGDGRPQPPAGLSRLADRRA